MFLVANPPLRRAFPSPTCSCAETERPCTPRPPLAWSRGLQELFEQHLAGVRGRSMGREPVPGATSRGDIANRRDASPRACAPTTTGVPAAAFLFVDLLNSKHRHSPAADRHSGRERLLNAPNQGKSVKSEQRARFRTSYGRFSTGFSTDRVRNCPADGSRDLNNRR